MFCLLDLIEEGGVWIAGSSSFDFTFTISNADEQLLMGTEDFKRKKTSSLKQSFGGKGANQAVMVRNLTKYPPSNLAFSTCIGDDTEGKIYLEHFKQLQFPIDGLIFQVPKMNTNYALIELFSGNNRIVVTTGANQLLTPEIIDNFAKKMILNNLKFKVFLCQLETPVNTVIYALKYCKSIGMTTILNPAPAISTLPLEIFDYADYICPNETEAEILTGGISIKSVDDAKVAAIKLLSMGCKKVLITLGKNGSYYLDRDGLSFHTPAISVSNIGSTTGAGDCFCGCLAYLLSSRNDKVTIQQAVDFATKVVALAIQKEGAHEKYPNRQQLLSFSL